MNHTHNNEGGIIKALVTTMIGFVSLCTVAGHLAKGHPTIAVLPSLLLGFAPLIGLGALIIITALFISFLISSVERMYAGEDDGIVPEPHCKSKWDRDTYFPTNLMTYRLALKEHSPPSFLFS